MTRGLHFFLRDMFDTDDAAFINQVTSKYTGTTGVMSVDAMLSQDTRVRGGLWFSELFKEVFGCYPCYNLLKRFLDTTTTTAAFDVNAFCEFLTKAVPVVRLFTFNKPILEKKLAFCRACDPKVLFAQKLRHRYGLGPAEYQPMLQTYRECWKHTGGTLQSLVDALSANLGTTTLVVPEFTSSAVYFRFQQQAINHFGLDRTNPFDHTRLPHYVPSRSPITLFDAMSECATEASVLLKLMGANVLCGEKTWVDQFPAVEGTLTLTYGSAETGLAFYADALLPYFPKVANTFVSYKGTAAPLSREPARCFAFTGELTPKYAASLSTTLNPTALWVNALGDKFSFGANFDKLHWKSIMACSPSVVFEEFLSRYLCQHKEAILNAFAPRSGAPNAVVLIDTRDNIMSVISMLITFSNLRRNAWDAVIVCKERNRTFYEGFLGSACKFVKAPNGAFSIDNYNTMLKSAAFWRELAHFERVLIIQDDGMLVRQGLEEASYFDRDFVGAPWDIGYPGNDVVSVATGGKLVGNGGLSLRRPRVMERVCLEHGHQAKTLHIDLMQQEPEDVFFARLVPNPATTTEAALFSSEELLNGSSLGFHKPWVYHSWEKIEDFFNALLHPEYQIKTAGRMGR
jgi:hypothetical protein